MYADGSTGSVRTQKAPAPKSAGLSTGPKIKRDSSAHGISRFTVNGKTIFGSAATCEAVTYKHFRSRIKSTQSQNHGACGDQYATSYGRESHAFSQKYGREYNHENDAQFINRSNLGGLPYL
jgi:hypothetical protein